MKQRHESAIRQIDVGMGLSELIAFSAETWGCSCRNARDVVCAAYKDWLGAAYGSEEIDQRDLLFQQVGRPERIARKAENAGQFSAAVGATYGAEPNDGPGYSPERIPRSQDAFPPVLIWISWSMLHIGPR